MSIQSILKKLTCPEAATSSAHYTEIDHHITRLIVGAIAVSLAFFTNTLSLGNIDSISASYHFGGLTRDIFVGFLFAISAFLLSYNGRCFYEAVLSKIAAFAALGVAIFPCECKVYTETIPIIHGLSALIMFLILAYFCNSFYQRAIRKPSDEAKIRAKIYAISGYVIIGAILLLVLDAILGNSLSTGNRLIFYCEAAALIAFGISWLTASRVFPLITDPTERISILPEAK